MAALDAALGALDLDQLPIIVVGHSMGGVLAIRWAATHPDRTRAVLTFGAPLYRTRAEADQRMGDWGWTSALLAGTGRVPRAVCAWTCRHRGIASWLAVGSRPDLPVSVARGGVNHTWATYSDSLDSLVRHGGWAPALEALDERGTRVVIADGARDPVPVHGRAGELARELPSVRCAIHEYADHLLPLSDPRWCRALIEAVRSPDLDLGPSGGEEGSAGEEGAAQGGGRTGRQCQSEIPNVAPKSMVHVFHKAGVLHAEPARFDELAMLFWEDLLPSEICLGLFGSRFATGLLARVPIRAGHNRLTSQMRPRLVVVQERAGPLNRRLRTQVCADL